MKKKNQGSYEGGQGIINNYETVIYDRNVSLLLIRMLFSGTL